MTDQTVHGHPWEWHEPQRGEHFRRCNFCGSINPDDLAAEVELGSNLRAEWADWKYAWPHKLYLDVPNREPNKLFAIGSSNFAAGKTGWVARDELTDEQRMIIERDHGSYGPTEWTLFGTRSTFSVKLYSVHMTDPAVGRATRQVIEQLSGIKFTRLGDDRSVRWERVTT